MKFEHLPLKDELLQGLESAGYVEATPIQQRAVTPALKGRDLIACAQTGTGKTAAFSLPLLQRLMSSQDAPTGAAKRRRRSGRRIIRALILAPTRELAGQISDSLRIYGRFTGLRNTVVYGGVNQNPQVRNLRAGVDILVATPGRLLDLIQQGHIDLGSTEIVVLDEADRMLDMGFIHDLKKIMARVPAERQTLMFSATMPREVRELAAQWLTRPSEVSVEAETTTPERVSQAVYFVEKRQKAVTLIQLLRETKRSRTLVFSRTKHGADKIARFLKKGGIQALALHGGKSQSQRQSVMREFKSQRAPVLVATDLAARGLDISDISHVINYDLPDSPETYIHRIGRTARAGAEGQAISFCQRDERHRVRLIEKITGQSISIESVAVPSGTLTEGETDEGETARPAGGRSGSDKSRSNRSRTERASKPARGKKRNRHGAGQAEKRGPKARSRRNPRAQKGSSASRRSRSQRSS